MITIVYFMLIHIETNCGLTERPFFNALAPEILGSQQTLAQSNLHYNDYTEKYNYWG